MASKQHKKSAVKKKKKKRERTPFSLEAFRSIIPRTTERERRKQHTHRTRQVGCSSSCCCMKREKPPPRTFPPLFPFFCLSHTHTFVCWFRDSGKCAPCWLLRRGGAASELYRSVFTILRTHTHTMSTHSLTHTPTHPRYIRL